MRVGPGRGDSVGAEERDIEDRVGVRCQGWACDGHEAAWTRRVATLAAFG
jgi:hypothetical protein